MKILPSLALLLPALALVAGCQEEKKPVSAGKAGGEILEASVSDAMLPLDTVRSSPPLAPKSDDGSKEDGKEGDKTADKAADKKPAAKPAAKPAEVRSAAE